MWDGDDLFTYLYMQSMVSPSRGSLGCCVQAACRRELQTTVRICSPCRGLSGPNHQPPVLDPGKNLTCLPVHKRFKTHLQIKLAGAGHDVHVIKSSLEMSEASRGHTAMPLYNVSAPPYGGIVWNTNLLLAVSLKENCELLYWTFWFKERSPPNSSVSDAASF